MSMVEMMGRDGAMWAVLGLAAVTLTMYIWEKISLELTSLGLIVTLLLLFHFAPVTDETGAPLLTSRRLLEGFANPALLTVTALLVVGRGMILTGGVSYIAGFLLPRNKKGMIAVVLFVVLCLSAFLNNTPVVVIFIPIIQALAERGAQSPSALMIPLSFAAILGGMTTLIGSSTNLLVSSSLIELNLPPLHFFQFTGIGVILAGVGFVYVVLVAPRILPSRASLKSRFTEGDGKQFIAQITVGPDSRLIGTSFTGGLFKELRNVTIQMVLRGEHSVLPHLDDGFEIRSGDVLVVAATRAALTGALESDKGLIHAQAGVIGAEGSESAGQLLAEVMLPPGSKLLGQNLEMLGFRYQYKCIVLGIQRRSRMIRSRMTEIRLETGDVLLVQGRSEDVEALRGTRDLVLLEWSTKRVSRPVHARRAALIFIGVIALAAAGMVPIVISAFLGAVAMLAAGVINFRQAARAIDSRVVLLVAAALALGNALQATGGAEYVATQLLGLMGQSSVVMILSAFFLLVAGFTKLLSNNACAVLFTPIGIGLAQQLGVSPTVFAITVLLAANCSFASPVGYQTNLLVMGPGHYRFVDFLKAGVPLIVLLWLVFTAVAPWWFGL